MTRIDFYILQKTDIADRHNFVCRLVDKAVAQGNRVMIATNNEAETLSLDEQLWQFRPESFVPHQPLGDDPSLSLKVPVVISHHSDDPNHHDVLVNLREDIPPEFSRYQRLAEVVVQEPSVLESTRKHYGFYKSRGYQLNNHSL